MVGNEYIHRDLYRADVCDYHIQIVVSSNNKHKGKMKFVNSYQVKEERRFKYHLARIYGFSFKDCVRIRDYTFPNVYKIIRGEKVMHDE